MEESRIKNIDAARCHREHGLIVDHHRQRIQVAQAGVGPTDIVTIHRKGQGDPAMGPDVDTAKSPQTPAWLGVAG